MRIEFTQETTTLNKKKLIIIGVCTILFVVLFSFLGIKAAQSYNKKRISVRKEKRMAAIMKTNEIGVSQREEIINEAQEGNNANDNQNQVEERTIEKTVTQGEKLPVYSEEAKQKMKTIYQGEEKIAYLTFDDGPSQAVTPQILDLLKQENIKVTFFVLGRQVKANPELVKREYQEGHYIANHGYTHEYATIYKSVKSVLSEYNRTETEIQKAIGNKNYHSHLFRFPGGYYGGKYYDVKKKAAKELNNKDISFIDWNALTSDAAGANTKKKIISNLKSTVKDKNKVVILMHDASGKILTYETLGEIIQYLREQGYTFDNFYSIMK